jgi:preprotein translocase subunit SecA
MIEVKEGCAISTPTETLARISHQRFFTRYRHLSGMTGTAREAAAELHDTYGLGIVRIPTLHPSLLQHQPDHYCTTLEAKWQSVVETVQQLHAQDRPVLVGTRSVADSEHLSRLLQTNGLTHRVLNARQDRDEAELVAGAGHRGAITVATNMAGRGTDIPLAPGVAGNGGLHVIAAERNDARRIDRQLFGRCARHGDPGSCQSILSLEDELVVRFLPKSLRWLVANWVKGSSARRRLTCRMLFRLCQLRSEHLSSRRRRELQGIEEYHGRVLAFSGRPE